MDEREQRRTFFEEAAEMTPLLAAPMGPYLLLTPTWDDTVALMLFVNHDRGERRRLTGAKRILDRHGLPFDTVVDVGANIGTTTLAAVELGARRVLAIEPDPRNHRTLDANIALNGLGSIVSTRQAAAASRPGTVDLYLSPSNSGDNRVRPAPGERRDTINVPAITVSQALADAEIRPESVSLVWLDVQGAELDVLHGAADVAGVPLVIEYAPELLPDPDALLTFLADSFSHIVDLRERTTPMPAKKFTPAAGVRDLLALRLPDNG
jgi:FkbM family methyltransferase